MGNAARIANARETHSCPLVYAPVVNAVCYSNCNESTNNFWCR